MTDRFFELAEQINAGTLQGMSTANLAETLRTHAQAPMTDPIPPDAKCSQEWGTNELRRMVDSVAHIQSPLSAMVYAAAAELEDLRPRLAASRRNEALRAQARDEAIASGKVLAEANLRHFKTATENHNRAEALWNELVEVTAQAKEWERRFNWKADASNTELAEMTKRAEAAEEADTDLLRRCEVGENQLAREQKRGQFDYEQAEKARGERDDARNEIASVTAERDALREELKTVAERQREACATTCELIRPVPWGNHEQQEALDNWKTAARFVHETPLVTDVPAVEREAEEEPPWAEDTRKVNEAVARRAAAMPGRCIHCGCTFETGQHQGYDMDHEFEPAVAMANEAIREENASLLCKPSRQELCALETFQPNVADYLRDLESQLATAVTERDAAVENSKSAVREGQARALRYAIKEARCSDAPCQRKALFAIADRIERGEVTP